MLRDREGVDSETQALKIGEGLWVRGPSTPTGRDIMQEEERVHVPRRDLWPTVPAYRYDGQSP